MESENYSSDDVEDCYFNRMNSSRDISIYATLTHDHDGHQNGGHSSNARLDNQRYDNGLTKGVDSSVSVNEEDILNISKESLKNTAEVEREINSLLKQHHQSEEEILNDINTGLNVDKHSLFEDLVRKNHIIGENFVLVWLNQTDNPKNFYERAKNNLSLKLKYYDRIFTEKDFTDELTAQVEKELLNK